MREPDAPNPAGPRHYNTNVCSNTAATVGVSSGWIVLPFAGEATKSNVSAFVVPGLTPVADDDRQQLPMFPTEDPAKDLLLHVIKMQAEGIRMMAAANHALTAAIDERAAENNGMAHKARQRAGYQPQNTEFRDWKGFRAHLQDIEAKARKHLGPRAKITKEVIYAHGGPHPRTTTRIMTFTFGLQSDYWPPSTWSEDLPADGTGQNLRLS